MAQEETTTKTEVGYIESVKLFAETMHERYIKGQKKSLLILASDEKGTQTIILGDSETMLLSFASSLHEDPKLLQLVKASMSLLILGKLEKIKGILD